MKMTAEVISPVKGAVVAPMVSYLGFCYGSISFIKQVSTM